MNGKMRLCAGLMLLLALTMLFGTAAMAKTTLTFTEGTNATKTVYRNNGNIVEVTLASGKLPAGLAWNWDKNRIWIYGTPSKAGKAELTFSTVETDEGRQKTSTETVTVVVEAGKLKITKSPTDEKVREGGTCKFIAKADNAVEMSWHFVSPKNKDYRYSKIKEVFPRLSVKGGMNTTLEISNVPADMNGWSVYCRFYSDKTNFQKSGSAKITVTRASATAVPSATLAPTAPPAATATAEPPRDTPIPSLPPIVAPDGGSGQQGGGAQGAGGPQGGSAQGGSSTGMLPAQGAQAPAGRDHTVLFVVAGAAILVVMMLCGTLIYLSRMREAERRERERRSGYDD